ncbi:hypothetical protein G7Y79_00007g021850 [Physcia stellaris]|nr:hypothetical protein G7Y79_00007g021850 [Physcia stellaris]
MSTQLSQILHCFRHVRLYSATTPARSFSSRSALFSGHNKWAKIKHDKAKEDVSRQLHNPFSPSSYTSNKTLIATSGGQIQATHRSYLRTKDHRKAYNPPPHLPPFGEPFFKALERRSSFRSQTVHGPDPTTNPRLATLIATAKKSGLPKATLEGAIARGAGKSPSGAALESLTIEAMLPSSIAAIIECQTDNKARTLSDIRYLIKEFGGTVTPTNHLFERAGKVVLQGRDDVLEDDVYMCAIEAGCTDIESANDGNFSVYTEPQETAAVAEAIVKSTGLQILSTDIIWAPKEETQVQESASGLTAELVEKLEDDPSVQNIFLNIDRRMV